jgi:mycothiol synthase
MKATARPYGGLDDTRRMAEMLVATRASLGHGCWHVGDLVWRLFLHARHYDLGQTVRLWVGPGGDLLGFAVVTPAPAGGAAYFELQVHPGARGQGLEEQMLGWIEAVAGPARRLVAEPGVYDDDAAQIDALLRRGFERAEGDSLLLLHPLDAPVPEPVLPAGFQLRAVAGPHEAAARAASQRDAFHPSRTSDEHYRCLMDTPGYDRNLDLVAVAPDGTFAAFCLAWLDGVNGVGLFEPVGTRVTYRRLGLARAVLLAGMERQRSAGMEGVVVGPVSLGEKEALGLYRSVGFGEIRRVFAYVKECC